MSVAKAARERIYGIKKADSGTELAGTAVGRLYLHGLIGRRHLDAAKAVAARRAAYARAIDLGRCEPQAVDVHAIHGRSYNDVTPEEAAQSIGRWDEIVAALDRAGRKGQLYALVWEVAIRDHDSLRETDLLKAALDVVADVVGLPLDISSEAA